MAVLTNYEPKRVWANFEAFCEVPHGTFDMDKISAFCYNWAVERGLEAYQDEAKNVVIKKPGTAGYENSDPVIIQGHMDMVCEKVPGSDHDFKTDGLKLFVEDGKLEIESLFSFEGINPDADNATGEDIAAISVKNLSGMYLEEAKITVLANEEELQFAVTDLPEGSSANAFSIDNAMLESSFVCDDVKCEAVFKDNEVGIPEQITVEENGTQISVTNNSEQELSKVTIYCRCPFEEEYFGGIAYQYEIQGLATGETKLVNAEDFFLGIVEVVRIEVE